MERFFRLLLFALMYKSCASVVHASASLCKFLQVWTSSCKFVYVCESILQVFASVLQVFACVVQIFASIVLGCREVVDLAKDVSRYGWNTHIDFL